MNLVQYYGLTAEQWLEYVGFLGTAGVALVSGLGVLFARRVLHAAVWLLFCLLGVAGLFALMGAHVLFGVQILVYAGAIAVMIIFAVLLLERTTGRGILSGNRHLFAGVVSAGAFVVVMAPTLGVALWAAGWPSQTAPTTGQTNVALIGRLFLTRHLLAFELMSVVLLVAMIGAIVLARAERRSDAEEAPEAQGGGAAHVPTEEARPS